jgi:hypothetical protein
MSNGEAAKETVIIVHGTWAAPAHGERRWYQPSESTVDRRSFVSKLDDALARNGSNARCWAHCAEDNDIFTWSGNNVWLERAKASNSLAGLLNKLQASGWRCHLVAHSHGGNAVAEALPQLKQTSQSPIGLNGTVATLGTPFIDAMSPIYQLITRRRKITARISWVLFGFLFFSWVGGGAAVFIASSIAKEADPSLRFIKWFYGALAFIAIAMLALRLFRGPPRSVGWTDFWRKVVDSPGQEPRILCINSRFDEAWQILHHIRNIENPLRITRGFFGHLHEYWRNFNARGAEASRIHGARTFKDLRISGKIGIGVLGGMYVLGIIGSFIPILVDRNQSSQLALVVVTAIFGGAMSWLFTAYAFGIGLGSEFTSASLAPYRWLWRQVVTLRGIPNTIATYVVRLRAWSLAQEMIMGLEGYRHVLPHIRTTPIEQQTPLIKHEELPKAVEERALARRDAWIGRNLSSVSETFSKLVMTVADLEALLRTVEHDLSLVHAAYYTDDECIERIARWIAGKG